MMLAVMKVSVMKSSSPWEYLSLHRAGVLDCHACDTVAVSKQQVPDDKVVKGVDIALVVIAAAVNPW